MAISAVSPLEITDSRIGATHELTVRGELDIASADVLRGPVRRAIGSGAATTILDLRELEFIDSTGIHLLLDARNYAHVVGTRLVVLRPDGAADSAFDLSGVTRLFPRAESPRFVTEWAV